MAYPQTKHLEEAEFIDLKKTKTKHKPWQAVNEHNG